MSEQRAGPRRSERATATKLRGLSELLRPYRGRVAIAIASLIVATGASLAPPYLAKLAIDNGITPGDVGALDVIVAAFIASALLYWGATYVQTYLVGWVGQRALQDLRLRIFRHLQRQSIGFFGRVDLTARHLADDEADQRNEDEHHDREDNRTRINHANSFIRFA